MSRDAGAVELVAARGALMADSTQALAYEEALRGVTQQQQVLDGIRARASTLLGIAAISASFLGGVALNTDRPTGPTWIPIGAFVAVGLLTTWILLPIRGWTFSLDAKILIKEYVEGDAPAELPEMYRDLALYLGRHYVSNDKRLGRLFLLFKLASGLLVVEVVTWLLVLGWK
jgi:hypothetical protein